MEQSDLAGGYFLWTPAHWLHLALDLTGDDASGERRFDDAFQFSFYQMRRQGFQATANEPHAEPRAVATGCEPSTSEKLNNFIALRLCTQRLKANIRSLPLAVPHSSATRKLPRYQNT